MCVEIEVKIFVLKVESNINSLTVEVFSENKLLISYDNSLIVTCSESRICTINSSELYNMLIAVLTALTIVVGMRIMGTMLISSLIIFPTLSASAVVKGFRKVVIISGIVSVVCFFAGLYSSYSFNLPVGASIVLANFVVFSILMIVGKILRR